MDTMTSEPISVRAFFEDLNLTILPESVVEYIKSDIIPDPDSVRVNTDDEDFVPIQKFIEEHYPLAITKELPAEEVIAEVEEKPIVPFVSTVKVEVEPIAEKIDEDKEKLIRDYKDAILSYKDLLEDDPDNESYKNDLISMEELVADMEAESKKFADGGEVENVIHHFSEGGTVSVDTPKIGDEVDTRGWTLEDRSGNTGKTPQELERLKKRADKYNDRFDVIITEDDTQYYLRTREKKSYEDEVRVYGEGGLVESDMVEFKTVDGTRFHKETPTAVCEILNKYIHENPKENIKIHFDNGTDAGLVEGYIRRAADSKVPLCVFEEDGSAGYHILDHAITEIDDMSGNVLYDRHNAKFNKGGAVESENETEEVIFVSLQKLVEYSEKIPVAVKDEKQLPAWIMSNVAKSEQSVANVKHRLETQYPEKFADGGVVNIDSDGEFLAMQCRHINKYSIAIQKIVKEGVKLDEWMVSLLSIAGDEMDNAYHYIDFELNGKKFENGGTVVHTEFEELISFDKVKSKSYFISKYSDGKTQSSYYLPAKKYFDKIDSYLKAERMKENPNTEKIEFLKKQKDALEFFDSPFAKEIIARKYEQGGSFDFDIKKGDLVYDKEVGFKPLIGLVVSDIDGDGEYEVLFRGLNGDTQFCPKSELVPAENYLSLLQSNGDLHHYGNIAKKEGITLNPKYQELIDELELTGEHDEYAKGGAIADKLESGITVKEFKNLLSQEFPDSFTLSIHKPKKGTRQAQLIAEMNTMDGLKDEELKGKLVFPKVNIRGEAFHIYQGGENTYFDFAIDDASGEEYIGSFGFKDRGDVSSEYITRFIAFLQEAYGQPFQVEHSVYEKGGTLEQDLEIEGVKHKYLKDGFDWHTADKKYGFGETDHPQGEVYEKGGKGYVAIGHAWYSFNLNDWRNKNKKHSSSEGKYKYGVFAKTEHGEELKSVFRSSKSNLEALNYVDAHSNSPEPLVAGDIIRKLSDAEGHKHHEADAEKFAHTKDGVKVEKGTDKYKGHIFYEEDGTAFECLGYFPKIDDCVYRNVETGKSVVGCMDGFYFNDPTRELLGETETGKKIFNDSAYNMYYDDFTPEEHKVAADMLNSKYEKFNDGEALRYSISHKGRATSKEIDNKSSKVTKHRVSKKAKGGDVSDNGQWIKDAIKHKGSLRKKAIQMGLITKDEKLSIENINEIEKLGKAWFKKAELAKRLMKFKHKKEGK